MKANITAALAGCLLLLGACTMAPKSDQDKASYAIGTQVGGNLDRVKDRVALKSVTEGLQDKVLGKPSRVSDEDMAKAMQEVQASMQAQGAPAADDASKDKAGYAIGGQIGGSLARFKDDLNLKQVIAGIKDKFEGKTLKLTDAEIAAAMQAFQQKAQAEQMASQKGASDKNLKEGAAFLESNKKNPKVKVTASGLQYEELRAGTGKKPKATSTVSVNYRGTLIDGTEFDSSYKRGQPVEFPVNGVIPGWTEALKMMQVGAKWRIVLPGNIAYGERGAGQQIGPNAVLVFEVELLKIVK
jgi:FKBP-type peptidyl-prolyl cis-trans isomerase